MIAYAATIAAFWIGVALLTLVACRAVDRAVTFHETCARRRATARARARAGS